MPKNLACLCSVEKPKILVFFLSGIGNMVQFLPTLRAIRGRFPDAEITLCVKHMVVYEVIRNLNLIDKVQPYYHKKSCNLFKQAFVYFALLKTKYDVIINIFTDKGYIIRLFTWGLRGKIKLGYRANNFSDYCYTNLFDYHTKEHESDRHFKIAQFLDKEAIKSFPNLCLGQKEEKFAQHFLAENRIALGKLIIGFHPGCSEFAHHRRWSPENFAKVADMLSEKYNAEIIIFGGKEEIPLSEKVAEHMKISKPFLLAGKAMILETAALIRKCDLFISNDSGLMHLAGALGTPLIAIFGPTNLNKSRPLGAKTVIVKKQTNCAPCAETLFAMERCKNRVCLSRISVDEVVTAAESILSLISQSSII